VNFAQKLALESPLPPINIMPQFDLTSPPGIQQYLDRNGYKCDFVERLAEGFSGFVYRAILHESTASLSP